LYLIFDTALCAKFLPGKQVNCELKATYGLKYLLYLPANYKPDGTDKWPLIIFLHGSGERGNDLNKVKTWGPPRIAEEKGLPLLLISPQCPEKDEWISILSQLRDLIDTAIVKLNVDTSRIYLTGLSMGGYGALPWPRFIPIILPRWPRVRWWNSIDGKICKTPTNLGIPWCRRSGSSSFGRTVDG
jgi:hypothetical protein